MHPSRSLHSSALSIALAAFALAQPSAAQSGCISAYGGTTVPRDGRIGGAVGHRIAISATGHRAATSSAWHVHDGLATGGAWVLSYPGTTGEKWTELRPSAPAVNMYFGYSLAMDGSGDVVIVGAPMSGSFLGAKVFVYRFDGSGWSEEWHVNGIGSDAIGYSAAISAAGDVFATGAPERAVGIYDNIGAVEVYRRDANGWTNEATLRPADWGGNDAFGTYIAMSADGKTIAARSHDTNTLANHGAIYLFEHGPSGWVEAGRVWEPVIYSIGLFATSLSLDGAGTLLAAGSPGDSRIAPFQGAVELFHRGASGWAYHASVLPTQPLINGGAGVSVALSDSGDRLIVGVPGHQLGGVVVGAVEEYELVNGTYQSVALHPPPVPELNALFGHSVAASATGKRWVTGEMHADRYGPNAGLVHYFDAPCLGPSTYCTAQTSSTGCVPAIGSTGIPSATRPSGFVVTASSLRNQRTGHLFYGTNGRQALPWKGGTLCAKAPLRRAPLQSTGGNPAPIDDCSGSFAFDFNAWNQSGADPSLYPGVVVYAQYVSRDPGSASGFDVTDALEFRLEP